MRALLMGGQACVLYGAAEFSREADFAILVEPGNLERLNQALAELEATCIAVPPFEVNYLERGYAVHFRCQHAEARGIRIDLMARMRGVDPFEQLWSRRSTLSLPDGLQVDLPDLVQAKKTQRDKDWPMIRRLLESHYFSHRDDPSSEQIEFWMGQLRTPELIAELVERYPDIAARLSEERQVISVAAADRGTEALTEALRAEEDDERARDQAYWKPLREELSRLRRRS